MNYVPTFDASPFTNVTASPGDMGSLVSRVIGMGNQSQAMIEALGRGEMPANLMAGVEGLGIPMPKPPSMALFMEYSNMEAAHGQIETATGDRIKADAKGLVEVFYKTHHLEFDANGNPRVAAAPAPVTATGVDTAGAAAAASSAAAALSSANQALTQATAARNSAQTSRTSTQASLTAATGAATTARAAADTLAAAAVTDPNGIVPNSNPPVTNSQAAATAAADAAAAEAAVVTAQNQVAAAEAAATKAAADFAAAQAAALAAQTEAQAANSASQLAEQQAQIAQNTAQIENLSNQLGAQETLEQRQARSDWEARQEAAARASFEPERKALEAKNQAMIQSVQSAGRMDPDVMEGLKREEADLNTRIEKAVILAKLPPGAASAPPNSELGQLYASIQSDFSEFDALRANNRSEMENSVAGREIKRFLAESKQFMASLPTREQAFDPNAMRDFAQRMGLTGGPPVNLNLGAPSFTTSSSLASDAGIPDNPEADAASTLLDLGIQDPTQQA